MGKIQSYSSFVSRWHLCLMEIQCAIDNETFTAALVVLHYKRHAKNRKPLDTIQHEP